MISITQTSNVLGTKNPIASIVKIAKKWGVPVLVDGTQAIVHESIDVSKLDCDFYVLSSHKMYGPTGIGALYVKPEHLQVMSSYQVGGGMIESVELDTSSHISGPQRFEAGTPNIEGTIGFGACIQFLSSLDLQAIQAHEDHLYQMAASELMTFPNLRILGTCPDKSPILSFCIDDIHAHDVVTILDHYGVATRAGHQCTMPLHKFYKTTASTRASFALYNNEQDVEQFINAMKKVYEIF